VNFRVPAKRGFRVREARGGAEARGKALPDRRELVRGRTRGPSPGLRQQSAPMPNGFRGRREAPMRNVSGACNPSEFQNSLPGRALAKPVSESPWLTSLPHSSINHRPTRTRCAYACATSLTRRYDVRNVSEASVRVGDDGDCEDGGDGSPKSPRSQKSSSLKGKWKTTTTTKANKQDESACELARTALLGRAAILFVDTSC
jgi:hypothetical protein